MMSWQYIAGFFDGEGSVGLRLGSPTNSIAPYLFFYQSSESDEPPPVLLMIDDFLKQAGIRCRTCASHASPDARIKSKKAMYVTKLTTREGVARLLEKLFPFLIVKKCRAQDLWRFLKANGPQLQGLRCAEAARTPERRAASREEMRRLVGTPGFQLKRAIGLRSQIEARRAGCR